jgi:hypothetical protein
MAKAKKRATRKKSSNSAGPWTLPFQRRPFFGLLARRLGETATPISSTEER